MSDVAVHHGMVDPYEPSLFGTYSKKIGMWLFLLSDSLTFGALLFAYTYGRISTPDWPTPFHSESIMNATLMTAFLLTSSLTMVFGVRAAVRGNAKAQRLWLLATMACGIAFIILHGREWSNLIAEGLTLPFFPTAPGETNAEFVGVAKNVPRLVRRFLKTINGRPQGRQLNETSAAPGRARVCGGSVSSEQVATGQVADGSRRRRAGSAPEGRSPGRKRRRPAATRWVGLDRAGHRPRHLRLRCFPAVAK